jgi:hypothetical protein
MQQQQVQRQAAEVQLAKHLLVSHQAPPCNWLLWLCGRGQVEGHSALVHLNLSLCALPRRSCLYQVRGSVLAASLAAKLVMMMQRVLRQCVFMQYICLL